MYSRNQTKLTKETESLWRSYAGQTHLERNWERGETRQREMSEKLKLAKSKANNTVGCWLYESLQLTSQPTHIVFTSSLLIRGPLVYLAKFVGSCV
jgi:murein tripeptide amidase MpaA